MTRIAYFQPFSGASGDMVLGALVDAGLPLARLEAGLGALGLKGWRLEARQEMRGPFCAMRVRVLLEGGGAHPHCGETGAAISGRAAEDPKDRDRRLGRLPPIEERPSHHHHDHHHDHSSHSHQHSHPHHHEDKQEAPESSRPHEQPSRRLRDIQDLLNRSALPDPVKVMSGKVFQRLAQAEARVHGIPVEEVHFHEVGAVDSIVDIAGACLGLHLLGVEEVHSAPVTLGTGFVQGAHGKIPLPAPATLELLRGIPVEQRDSGAELTTPTGAALLTTLSHTFGTMPPLTVEAVGYGAGDDRPDAVPNALRVILGEGRSPAPALERILVLQASVDDMSPQWLGHLMDRLFAAGAADVSFTPLLMKKGRPGHEVTVLAPLAAEAQVLRTLFAESTTFGLRRTVTERIILERSFKAVDTPWGTVRVKVGRLGNEVVTTSPEYEDLCAAASKASLPLKELHQRVMELYADKYR